VRAVVAEELARLPGELRLPLVLCYWDGADRPSAAARLGCSVSTLKRRLNAGRDQLADRLARRGFAGPAVLAALTAVQAGADASAVGYAAPGFASWKLMGTVVVAAGIAAGVGLRMSLPVAADTPAKPDSPTPAAAARPDPVVDRYGDPLPDGATVRFGTVRFRHGGQLHSVAFSPDGKTIASGGFGRVMLWEADTGKPLATLVRILNISPTPDKPPEPTVQQGHAFGLAFTLDGKRLLSVGSMGAGREAGLYLCWDVQARKLDAELAVDGVEGTQWLRAVAVSRDGKTVAFGTDSGKLYVVDAGTQGILAQAQIDGVAGLSFAPDGGALAVAAYRRVVVLDPTTLKERMRLEPGRARQVAFAPDGKSLWVGCDGGDSFGKDKDKPGTIGRWDLETKAAVQTFETAPGMLMSLAVSPDGKTLASGGERVGPFLWDAATGKAFDLTPNGSRIKPWVQGLAFAPDGKTLAVADTHGRVRVWDVAGRRELHRYDEHADGILQISLSPDGKQAATAGGDGTVRIWDVATGRAVQSWTADDTRSVFAVAYTPDGRSVLTSGWGGTVRLWDAATGKDTRRFRDDKGGARSALSPDGKLVAASGKDDQSITLYETATGKPIRELTGHVSHLMWLKFSPDGRRLFSAADIHSDANQIYDDRSVRVWDVATGQQLHKFDAGRPHGGVAVSLDGRVVAAGGSVQDSVTMRFWDLATGKEITDKRRKGVSRAAFSPDGRYLATDDHGIRLIEVASGKVAQTFDSGTGTVSGMTFTPDGRRLVTAHDDGTALIWNLTPKPTAGVNPGQLWDGLASDDAASARRAAAALAADPAAAVVLLGEKLKPVPKPAALRTTAALVAELDAPAFGVREAAGRELVGRVDADAAALADAMANSPSAEVRRRLGEILRSAPNPWRPLAAEDLRRVRAVGVLETIGTPEARRLLKALADGDPYAPLTREARAALGRLGS
jgi:WD40 repeat protein